MFTVCPKCNLKLVVTAADLRVAQGHVRCGRCSNVFNALVGLSDEAHAELSHEEHSTAQEHLEASKPQLPAPAEGSGPETRASDSADAAPTESDGASPPEGALEFDASSTDISEVFIEASPDDLGTTGQSETILLSSEEEPAEESVEGIEDAAGETAEHRHDDPDEDDGTEQSSEESAALDEASPLRSSAETAAFDETFTDQSCSESVALEEADDQRSSEVREVDDAADQLSGAASDAGELDRCADDSPQPSQPLEAEHPFEETDEFRLADLEFLLESSVAGENASDEPTSRAQTDADGSAAADAHDARAEGAARSTPAATAQASSTAEPQPGQPPQRADEVELGELAPARPRSRGAWKFAAGSAVLALALAAQVVNHYRAQLVDVPSLHGPLTAIYAALGKPLSPHWNVKAYAVRQLGAVVRPGSAGGAPGALSVRASIENTAPRAQPLPLLRVIVQDRFGNRVAARDVRPDAYLPGKSAKVGLLGPGKRVDAEIAFVDPGPRVVGFEIDACLESEAGRITCAHEPGARR